MGNELRYNLDTSAINYICKRCKQNDDRILVLTLFDKSIPFVVTGAILSLKAMRPNNTFVIQDTGLSIESNVVTIPMIRDITRIAGQVKLELKITLAGKDISTFTFMLEIEPSVIQVGDTASKNVITALERLDTSIINANSTNATLNTSIANGDTVAMKAKLDNITTNANGITSVKASGSTGQYGGLDIIGTKGGYTGFCFKDFGRYFLVNTLEQGCTIGTSWLWCWNNGVLTNGVVPWARLSDVPTELSFITGATKNIPIALSKKFNRWTEAVMTATQAIPATPTVNTTIDLNSQGNQVFSNGYDNAALNFATINASKQLVFSKSGLYQINARVNVTGLTVGKAAVCQLWHNGIAIMSDIRADEYALGVIGFSFSLAQKINVADTLHLTIRHNGTAANVVSANLQAFNLITAEN